MATTSLWHSKGQLGDLIAYVENPEKTGPKAPRTFSMYFRTSRTRRKPQTARMSPLLTA